MGQEALQKPICRSSQSMQDVLSSPLTRQDSAVITLISFKLDVTSMVSRCTSSRDSYPSGPITIGIRKLMEELSPAATWRDACSRVRDFGTSEVPSHSQFFDASRNGRFNVVSSRNSTKIFRAVHIRLSPGVRRWETSKSWKVGGKNAR